MRADPNLPRARNEAADMRASSMQPVHMHTTVHAHTIARCLKGRRTTHLLGISCTLEESICPICDHIPAKKNIRQVTSLLSCCSMRSGHRLSAPHLVEVERVGFGQTYGAFLLTPRRISRDSSMAQINCNALAKRNSWRADNRYCMGILRNCAACLQGREGCE